MLPFQLLLNLYEQLGIIMNNPTVKLPPAMKLRASFGVLAGLTVIAFGVARMLGLIDTGRNFENYPPIGMIFAGAAYIAFILFRLRSYKKSVLEEYKRLG